MCALGDYMNIQVHACIGGTSIRDDLRKLESGVHVVVGTPGRVNDMIQRRVLRTYLLFDSTDLYDILLMINLECTCVLL